MNFSVDSGDVRAHPQRHHQLVVGNNTEDAGQPKLRLFPFNPPISGPTWRQHILRPPLAGTIRMPCDVQDLWPAGVRAEIVCLNGQASLRDLRSGGPQVNGHWFARTNQSGFNFHGERRQIEEVAIL